MNYQGGSNKSATEIQGIDASTVTGSFVATSDRTLIEGGGAGGTGGGTGGGSGGGGGGGSWFSEVINTVRGRTYNYSIAKRTPGVSAGSNGTDGAATTVTDSVTSAVVCNFPGGKGGWAGNGASPRAGGKGAGMAGDGGDGSAGGTGQAGGTVIGYSSMRTGGNAVLYPSVVQAPGIAGTAGGGGGGGGGGGMSPAGSGGYGGQGNQNGGDAPAGFCAGGGGGTGGTGGSGSPGLLRIRPL